MMKYTRLFGWESIMILIEIEHGYCVKACAMTATPSSTGQFVILDFPTGWRSERYARQLQKYYFIITTSVMLEKKNKTKEEFNEWKELTSFTSSCNERIDWCSIKDHGPWSALNIIQVSISDYLRFYAALEFNNWLPSLSRLGIISSSSSVIFFVTRISMCHEEAE